MLVHESQQAGLHLYAVLIDFAALGIDRATVMNRLRERGIGTQVHYIPVHLQPYYRQRYGMVSLPGADAYYARCLSLPLFAEMTEADVERVVAALSAVLGA
jgi:dTDP-4-amino-4,6-dideoxygalactose transaminase